MNKQKFEEIEKRAIAGEPVLYPTIGVATTGECEFHAHARADVLALAEEVRNLRAALGWYADKSHYHNGVPKRYESDADPVARLVTDNGATARAALTLRWGAE
jgi:hypothetical protein